MTHFYQSERNFSSNQYLFFVHRFLVYSITNCLSSYEIAFTNLHLRGTWGTSLRIIDDVITFPRFKVYDKSLYKISFAHYYQKYAKFKVINVSAKLFF